MIIIEKIIADGGVQLDVRQLLLHVQDAEPPPSVSGFAIAIFLHIECTHTPGSLAKRGPS